VPVVHIDAPPVCQALFLSFQVSLPGSPGAGTVYFFHTTLPVAASRLASQPRAPRSPPAEPTTTRALMTSRAEVSSGAGWACMVVCQTTLPVFLSVAITRDGQPANGIT